MLTLILQTKQNLHACSVNSIGCSSELRLLFPPSLLWSEAAKEVRLNRLPTLTGLTGEMLLERSALTNTEGVRLAGVLVVTGVA